MAAEMIHINPEILVEEPIYQDPDTPMPVQDHVGALGSLVTRLQQEGKLSLEASAFGHLFAKRHDAGYGTDLNLLRTDYARDILWEMRDAVGCALPADDLIEYLHNNADNYLAARVVGHGVLGLVGNTLHFEQEHGLPHDKALGTAAVLSAHHPGFPIDMVAGFVGEDRPPMSHMYTVARSYLRYDVDIPTLARSLFLIDSEGENPELLRQYISTFASDKMSVSWKDTHKAAVFGYALDRLSAGTLPEQIWMNEDGSVGIRGGELIQKKYGLVAGDLRRDKALPDPSIQDVYLTTLDRLYTENIAAIQATKAAKTSDIQRFVEYEASQILESTQDTQEAAIRTVHSLGLSGSFSHLEEERGHLARYAWQTNDPNGLYALATYDAIK